MYSTPPRAALLFFWISPPPSSWKRKASCSRIIPRPRLGTACRREPSHTTADRHGSSRVPCRLPEEEETRIRATTVCWMAQTRRRMLWFAFKMLFDDFWLQWADSGHSYRDSCDLLSKCYLTIFDYNIYNAFNYGLFVVICFQNVIWRFLITIIRVRVIV